MFASPTTAPASTSPQQGPLCPCQEGIWFIEVSEQGQAAYNLPVQLEISGRLDPDVLKAALANLFRRHAVLRTALVQVEGKPLQCVDPVGSTMPALLFKDFSSSGATSASSAEAAASLWLEELACEPFRLDRQYPFRCALVQIDTQSWILQLCFHQACMDSWSVALLLSDLSRNYTALIETGKADIDEGAEIPASDQPLSYLELASLWCEKDFQEQLRNQARGMTQWLQGVPFILELPTDFPRPAQFDHQGAQVEIELPAALYQQLTELALAEHCTPGQLMLAVWVEVLARHARQETLVILCSNHERTQTEHLQLVGLLCNSLLLPIDLSQKPSLKELLQRLRLVWSESLLYQKVPFDMLVRAAGVTRDPSRHPLAQVSVVLQGNEWPGFSGPGVSGRSRRLFNGHVKNDLQLVLTALPNASLRASLEYATALFSADSARHLLEQWQALLRAALQQPQAPVVSLPLLTSSDQALLEAWNQTQKPLIAGNILQAFATQVSCRPHAVAVRGELRQLSYKELDQASDALASRLLAINRLRRGSIVAVALKRSPELVLALLAVLKAGAAYLPLDLSYPAQRLNYMLADAEAACLISHSELDATLASWGIQTRDLDVVLMDEIGPQADPAASEQVRRNWAELSGPSLAYINYTSGSTGLPKGVAVPHQGVLRLVDERHSFSIGPDDVVMQLAPAAFDAATLEIWGALLNGACVAVHPAGTPSTAELAEFLVREQVSVAWLTAALFHLMADEQTQALAGVRQLLAGGDVLSAHHVRRVLDLMPPGHALINGYGPTENTTFTCCHRMEAGLPTDSPTLSFGHGIPIGKPMANTEVLVLDAQGLPVPVGMPGELYTGGLGLALGYLGREALTAERFVPHPWRSGERLYRTGDEVRWRADGCLEFLGRMDQQVKIRGFRIELGEIEAALRGHPAVRDAVVIAHETHPGERELVAYVVCHADQSAGTADLREQLRTHQRQSLPDFMLPASLMFLESLPITPNGKLDRRALPPPEPDTTDQSAIAPANLLELKLLELWREALKRPQLGVNDNFFANGGHSLAAARLVHQIQSRLGISVHVSRLFSAQTVAEMAAQLSHSGELPGWTSLVTLQAKGQREPLFFVHGWGGDVYAFADMAAAMAPDQPVFGIQAARLPSGIPAHSTLEEMARHYADQLIALRPGPYQLAGYSLGGWVAWATAAELLRRGACVERLIMLDVDGSADMPGAWRLAQELMASADYRLRPLKRFWHALRNEPARDVQDSDFRPDIPESDPDQPEHFVQAHERYRPKPLPLAVDLITTDHAAGYKFWFWRFYARRGLRIHRLPIRHHLDFPNQEYAGLLARTIASLLD